MARAALRALLIVRCQGTISTISPDFMTLELNPPGPGSGERCAGCDGENGCSNSLFSSLFGQRTTHWRVPVLSGCCPGSRVEIQMPSGSLLVLAFVAYLMPVLCMLFLAVSAHYLVGNEPIWVSLGGLCGLVGGVIAYPTVSGLVFKRLDCAIEVLPIESGQLGVDVIPLIPHNQLSR